MNGAPIVKASVAGTSTFVVTATVAAAVPDADLVALVVALVLFAGGAVAFVAALLAAASRSRREELTLAGLFFLEGAPPGVRRLLLGSLAAEVVTALATAGARPNTSLAFGILAPLWGQGLAGLWGARHGRFPPAPRRRDPLPPPPGRQGTIRPTLDSNSGGGVAALSQDVIRSLASFKGGDAPVVSVYLDVDGRRFVRPRDYEVQLDSLLRQVADGSDRHRPDGDDLRRVESHVKGGIDRSRTRGLALFSCAKGGLWEVLELPVPVRNQVVVNATPHIRQLEAVMDENERFGVLLADRQRARMFVFELGQLVDKSEFFDRLPRHEDDRGDWDKDHVRDHSADAALHHLKRVADVAFSVFQDQNYDHLILGTSDDIAPELERLLHSYLKGRIAGRISVPVNASDTTIAEAALQVEAEVERAKEAAQVTRLRNAVGAGNGGVAGLRDVLSALVERRVETLIVSDGYEAPGWRCPSCSYLAVRGPGCPVCPRSTMVQVDDVVEEAVEEALGQSCRIEVVVGNADLDVLGRIGALLRF